MRSGIVLAGGRSTRFGEADKAFEPLDGTPMVRHVASRIAGVTDEVVVNCRDEQAARMRRTLDEMAAAWTLAVDPEPDQGPVAGIQTGLRAASGEYAAVVACDMPFVDPAFLEYLFDRATGTEGAVPRPDEYYEVTQAVYRREPMLAACDRALAAGERKVLAPLSYLDAVIVDGEAVAAHADPRTFENINTREGFEAAARVLGDDVDDGDLVDEAGEDDALDSV